MINSTKSTIRVSAAAAAVGMLAIGFAQTSLAAPMTFAQFHEAADSDGANLFSYVDVPSVAQGGVNTPTSAELLTDPVNGAATGIPVTFSYLNLPGLPADLQGVLNAVLTLTASTDTTVQTGFGGAILEEDIDGVATTPNTLTIALPASQGGGTLLKMTFTGELIGGMNSRTPQLSGDTNQKDMSGVTEQVVYSSDFVNFASGPQDYSLTFSSWTTTDSSSNGLVATSDPDPFFQSATAAGAGTFDATVVVPEPTTLALGGLLLVLGRRNKLSKLI